MRFFDRNRALAEAIDAAETVSADLAFAVDADSIDPAVFGLTGGYAATPARAPKIDMATAMQVPAVKRVHDLTCVVPGGIPLELADQTGRVVKNWGLFTQPERNVPRAVTMTRLFEDLRFEKIAWWRILEFNRVNFPDKVERLAPARVQVNESSGKVYVDGKEERSDRLIRFDSSSGGLLTDGARAIRTCLHLDAAAANMADGVPPAEYFTPGEHMDPSISDTAIIEMLDRWQIARRARSAGYVPAALEYHTGGWNAKDLQLAEARQHAVLEIARLGGVDPEELGVSTTSRTYSSDWTRRKAFLDFTLGGPLNAVRDRLNMPDVTPEGFVSRFKLEVFLQTDPLARYQTYKAGLEVGAIDPDEVREMEGKAPLARPPAAPLRAIESAPEENAS